MNLGRPIPTPDDFRRYGVNLQGTSDIIWQPQYDSALYAAAGQQQLNFFTQPIGQGTTSHPGGAGTKTLSDTNLTLQGQLPTPQNFLAVGLEVQVWSGLAAGRGPAAENTVGQMWNDIQAIARSGVLQFTVGTKPILQEAPIGNFPQQAFLEGNAALADATTAGANLLTQVEYAAMRGRTYAIQPTGIPSGQNFSVQLSWPNVIALPSTNATTRIFVRLLGFLARGVQ